MDLYELNDVAQPQGRTLEIELSAQEVITVELDDLDQNPDDVLELLGDTNCLQLNVWMRFACEYWKKGQIESAEKICKRAEDVFKQNGQQEKLPAVLVLWANLCLHRARNAPKLILSIPKRDDMTKENVKEEHRGAAASQLNKVVVYESEIDDRTRRVLALTRALWQMQARWDSSLDDADKAFDGVLQKSSTNLVALIGKAKIAFARKQFSAALKLYQQVLKLSPYSLPDPRIGIGLCFWSMNQKSKAKAAWQRSLEVHPKQWIANLLLGLEAINASKNPDDAEEDRTGNFIAGTKHIERAFNGNQRNASAANALCDFFMQKGDHKRALKLAERTIQFADILTVYSAGHIHAGYLAQADGSLTEAIMHFNAALKNNPKNPLAAIGLAQMQYKNDETLEALNTLDTLVTPVNPQRPLEAIVLLASLRANPRLGMSSADAAIERQKARELYEIVLKTLDGVNVDARTQERAIRLFGNDVDMFVEIAHLWQDDGRERMQRALQEAVHAAQEKEREEGKRVDPRLLNNRAVLRQVDGESGEARVLYEQALTKASVLVTDEGEGMSTTILYNLARLYEDQGEGEKAREAYEKLLSRHPEYIDAKIRQAQLLVSLNRHNDAHELLKQGLQSQKSNLNLRAFYTHFLITNNMIKPAKEFVFITLKEFDSHDIYSLCAAGWIHYHQARESRDSSPKGIEERRRGFQRSAEFYEKALQFDPQCAFAAQGLAIITAEDFLSPPPTSSAEDATRRVINARDALDVFSKVRESVNDASVYINMGHCYYARDEFDRAIESYETAAKRHTSGPNVAIILQLCRAWYARANKDRSYSDMKTALKYAQEALHLQPTDKAVLYNIAMIQQKAAEMLFAIPSAKRTLVDLQHAIDQGHYAQKLFASLAADTSPSLPYSKDMADQRRKYGDSLLRKGDEHLAAQRAYEEEQEKKLTEARQKRLEEKERQLAMERERAEELRHKAELLVEERRKAREEAQAWTLAVMGESDEEKEKRPRRRKQRAENGASGDEASEPRRKRKGKSKKEATSDVEEEPALFSGDDGEDRPVKKRTQKKRIVRDDDEEEAVSAPRKKQFKSKETISDSDEEMA